MIKAQPFIDLNLVRDWAMEAGKFALSQADRSIELKLDHTPVTEIDKQIESFLLEKIARHYPDHGLLAEEGSSRPGSEFTWIIDPIDGTRAFASGLPIWGISVGIFHQGAPYAGVFYMPVTREMYWGTQAEAFHNEQKLVPLTRVNLQSPLAFFAVPSSAHRHFDIAFHRMRSLGSVTAHLAYVAYGSATAAITRRVRIWDLASMLPALKVADVQLVYLSGKPFDPADLLGGEVAPEPLVAAHSSIIEAVRALVKPKIK